MKTVHERFLACIECVRDLQQRSASRDEALAALARLREDWPEARLDLTWDVETIGQGVAYAILVSLDRCTYSISAVAEGTLPWPLRRAVDPRAELLVTVDGVSISVGEAIGVFDFVWRSRVIADKIIDLALLQRERLQGRQPEPDEVAAAVRALREERGLSSDPAFSAYLAERRISLDQLQTWVGGVLVNRSLERAIIGTRAAGETATRPQEYARAQVAELELRASECALARRLAVDGVGLLQLCAQLDRGERSVAIKHRFRYEAAALFEAPLGTVNVLEFEGVSHAIQVLSREDAPPPDALQTRIHKRLIAERFRGLRSRANVEWHWGNADRSGSTYSPGATTDSTRSRP